jgi:predicted nucleic acid-binding protein
MTEASPPILVALDTNVLVYAEGEGDKTRCTKAQRLIAGLAPACVVLPVQVLGELTRVLSGRFKRKASDVRQAVLSWSDAFRAAETSPAALRAALDLHADHQLQIWDGLVLAVAAEQGCRVLFTEDLQPGFTWRGVTVVNPFAAAAHPLTRQALLAAKLADR